MLNIRKHTIGITQVPSTASFRFEKSIAHRLRTFLLTIVGLLLVAGVINSNQLFQLWKSQKHSSDFVIPSLTSSYQLESELTKYLQLSSNIQSLSSIEAIAETHRAMNEVSRNLRQTASDATSATEIDVTRDGPSQLINNLWQLQASTDDVARIRYDILNVENALTDNANNLLLLQEFFELTLEPNIHNMASLAEEMLLTNHTTRSKGNTAPSRSMFTVVNTHLSMVELLLKVTSVSERAAQLSKQRNVLVSAATREKISIDIRSAVQILAGFQSNELRRNLATTLKAIYENIVGEHGVLSNLKHYGNLAKALNQEASSQSEIANQLSKVSSNIVEIANNNSKEATTALKDTLLTTIIVSVLTTTLILVIVLLINSTIIEKQINQRMRKLTSAVLAIAEGDTDKKVDIRGDDEIGKMASALKVFKMNAQELHRSNHELEQFAYAASHDLRSPLRAIENLAQWTLEDAEDSLDETAKTNVEKILKRAHRLSTLQSDLLNYSRAGKQDTSIEDFNFKAEIDELRELLDPSSQFCITLNSQTTSVMTNAVPLRQVFLNLITNSIKHHDLEHGKIDISISTNNGRLLLEISDDGAGIEPQYHKKIFELFQGLQSKDNVEGSGLGLSLIKKLVNHYGGEIRVDSDPAVARGTNFIFDWPLYEPKQLAA